MRFWKRAGIVCGVLLLLFGVYYGSYRIYLYTFGSQDKEQFAKQSTRKSVEANSVEEHKITHKTKLTVEHYNQLDGTNYEEDVSMPVEYIGMSREELAQYLEKYAKSPSLADVEAGFEKYQIMSFSASDVVLRKIVKPAGTDYKYYMVAENGCVTVYYIDKRTIYEYTNILVDTLPEDMKEQVERGKYVRDDDALYDFLETYTS